MNPDSGFNQPHDALFRAAFSAPERAADLLRCILPADLAVLFPRVLAYSTEWRDPWLRMEYYGYPTLAEIFVFENVAVGGHEGNARLNAVEGNPGTATVSEVASGGIRMRPLVAILADNGVTAIAAMKVDIDGFEEKALGPFFREAADGLLPVRVVVETVLLTDETATFVKTMLDRGYVKTGQTRSNALFERRA